MRLEIKPDAQLSPDERDGLAHLSAEAFPPEENPPVWAKVDWHVLVWQEGVIASHVEIILREALVGGAPVRLGGIGGVSTLQAWRKHGFAEIALRSAQAFMRAPLAVDFGLLICGEPLLHYYGNLGWSLVANEMWISGQPQGRLRFDANIMVLPVCKLDWPTGEIDLCGEPW